MINIKVEETKIFKVKGEIPWRGVVGRGVVAKETTKNALKIKFSVDALKKSISHFWFSTSEIGGWFAVRDIKRLRAMRDLINEIIDEAEKLLDG